MPNLKTVSLTFLFLLYPVLIYLGFTYLSKEMTNLLVILFLLVRIFVQKKNGPIEKMMLFISSFMAIVSVFGFIFDRDEVVKLYPVLINLGLAGLFLFSLKKNNTPVIERIARLRENLDERGVRYTRKVTIAWFFFFIFNASVSFWTFYYADLELWTFYNAFLSYILIGVFFSIEYMIRRQVKKRDGHEA